MIKLETAVLLITYKRLDTTKLVFDSIRQAKPTKFYIASNNGKDDCGIQEVNKVREFLENNIDWDCKLYKLYRNKHLNAKESISGAIDWFFQNEEMGIVLEDDCLPSQSFFWFCQDLLLKYKNDSRIGHIGGTNPLSNLTESNSYYFSKYNRIWGWASWRRSWNMFDVDIKNWPEVKEKKILRKLLHTKKETIFISKIFDKVYKGDIDTWDYQWFFTRLLNSKAIIPNVNLISNIGFNKDATHTHDINNPLSDMTRGELIFPIDHPKYVIENFDLDLKWSKHITRENNILKRIISSLKSRL